MKVEVDSSGLEKLAAKLEKLATGAQERLQRPAKQGAERIVATAKGNVYQNGLHYVDGSIRDSLRAYTASDGESVTLGVETDLDIAVFHELGTGPVGTAKGHPGESNITPPVARRSTGWTYFSEDVAQKRAAESKTGEGKENGFVYTRGVPPKAFMHAGLVQNKESVAKMLQRAAMEEMGK